MALVCDFVRSREPYPASGRLLLVVRGLSVGRACLEVLLGSVSLLGVEGEPRLTGGVEWPFMEPFVLLRPKEDFLEAALAETRRTFSLVPGCMPEE